MTTFPLRRTCLARYERPTPTKSNWRERYGRPTPTESNWCERYGRPLPTEINWCELTWHPDDPLVVLVTLTVADCQTVTWPISRELLADGYVDGCAGRGDVHIDRDGRYMILQPTTPEGRHVVALPARAVGHVLICSADQAPIGRESVDVDSVIEWILGGAR